MNENDRKLWEAWGSPQPLTAEEVQNVQGGFNGNLGQLQQVVRQVRPDFYGKYDEASGRNLDTSNQNNSMTQDQLNGMSTSVPGYACGTDNAKPGYAVVGENGPEIINMKGGEQVYPLDQFQALSDYRMKMIQSDIKNGGQLSPFELRWLARKMDNGHFNHNGTDYDMFGDDVDTNDQDLLNAYAKNIYNYAYNYKPEAGNVDPSIDPSQEHIGPMAQDIEQVNPACVKETPEGVKTVDTARLAMMNAGVIADIARQLQDLTEKLKAIGVE
jgi:SLT domain-containing protein